jgi:NO-binding membrane sensor protein with MHYT domain/DNA-binding LytR/AlgR family response regulator
MQVSTAPWLVLLAIMLAVEGGYLGLCLSIKSAAARGLQRRLLLAGASFSFAAAIWAMHFTAVLVAPAPSAFLVFPLLLSFLLGVLIAGAAVCALSSGPFTSARLALAAGVLAAAIFVMHVVATMALPARVADSPLGMAAGVLIAFVGSALALWLGAGPSGRPPLLAAGVFGLAVTATHYVMAGARFLPQPAAAPALSSGMLAVVIAIVAFAITALFLLALVPEPGEAVMEVLQADFSAGAEGTEEDVPVVAAAGSGRDAKLRRGIYAPLGGAGAPPARLADHLPIERDGSTQFMPVEDVVAVQANAHYTYLFDGKAKLFCPLAIGEVESRLDRGRFMRVHRSHIVNIERVIGYKRSGDSETVELAAEERYTVPVSRSRAGWLKSRIDEKNGGSAGAAPPDSGTAT